MGSSPIFTEVIDVELNSGPLEESLTQLISMYQSKLQELSGSGLDAGTIGGLNVTAINQDLGSVRSELKSLTDAFMEAFGTIAAASADTGKATSTNITQALEETDAAASRSVKTQLENLSQIASGSEEAWGAFAQAAQNALTNDFDPRVRMTADLTNNLYSLIQEGGRPAFEALTAQQQDWFLGFQSSLAKVEDAIRSTAAEGSDAWQQAQQKQIAMVEQATNMMAADFKKRAQASNFVDASSDSFQRSQMQQVAMVEQATALMTADFKKRDAAANSVTVVGTDAWQQAQMREVAVVEQATALMEADFKKRAQASNFYDADSDAFQEAQMKQVAMVEQATRMMEADFAKRADAAKASAKATTEQSQTPAYSKGMDIGAQVIQLATLQVEWMAINAVINSVVDSVKAVVSAFSSGYEYLNQLETKAADLQGVLSSNVKLSQDQATNFQLTGEAAVEVQQKIEDASAKYGIAVETLDRGFKSFVDSGGATLTRSIGESVDVTVMLGAALKAAGKDADATRSMLAEYPKLLDGTVTSSSKVLETLGLTKDQWMAIREEALEHHDLLDQMTPLLQNYVAVATEAQNRHEGINAEMTLMLSRLEALVAKDTWDYFLGVLQSIRDYWTAHQVVINGIATAIGQLVADVLHLFTSLASVASQSSFIQTVVALIVTGFVSLIAGADTLVNSVSAVLNVTTKLMSLITDPNAWAHPLEAMKELMDYAQSQADRLNQSFEKSANNLGKILSTPSDGSLDRMIKSTDDDLLDQPLLPGGKDVQDNQKVTKDAIVALKAEYQSMFDANKKAGDDEKQQIALNLAARKTSVEQAAKDTSAASDAEYAAQEKLIALYKQKASVIAAPPASRNAFINSLSKQGDSLDSANDKAVDAQQVKATSDALKTQDQGYAQSEAAAKKDAAEQLAIIDAKIKASTVLASDGYKQELAVATAAHAEETTILQQEVVAAGSNAALKQAATAKLTASDEAYTAFVRQNAEQRTAALLKEAEDSDSAENNAAKTAYNTLVDQTTATKQFIETNLQATQSALKLAEANLQVAEVAATNAANEVIYARELGITGAALDALTKKQDTANAARQKASAGVSTAQKAVVATDPIVPALQQSLSDWKTLFTDFSLDNKTFAEQLTTFGTNLANTMTTTTASIAEASKIATGLMKAIQEGGAQGTAYGLGATGGALSSVSAGVAKATKDGGSIVSSLSSSMKSLFANAGVVGSLMSAAAGLISVITSLFTAAAQRIADNIKKAFDTTMEAYQNGNATLQATLQQVQAERNDAVSQLSGQKGGQDQLDKLLPQLDSEIAQLQQQQQTIITNFDTSLEKLKLNSDVLGQTLDTWNQINASVQEYIAAGGDAATAAEYMSESLAKMREDAATALSQGDQDAITEALNYNALLVQRQALIDAYNKSKFDTLNADALERRASNGVDVGLTQQAADQTYQSQLSDLDSQISQAATEVSMYKQIYDIASDTATLQAQSAGLQIQALATQLQTLKDQATVYNSIYENPDGTYGTNNGAGTAAGASNTTVIQQLQVNLIDDGTVDGAAIASSIQSELERSGRYGTGSTFSTN